LREPVGIVAERAGENIRLMTDYNLRKSQRSFGGLAKAEKQGRFKRLIGLITIRRFADVIYSLRPYNVRNL